MIKRSIRFCACQTFCLTLFKFIICLFFTSFTSFIVNLAHNLFNIVISTYIFCFLIDFKNTFQLLLLFNVFCCKLSQAYNLFIIVFNLYINLFASCTNWLENDVSRRRNVVLLNMLSLHFIIKLLNKNRLIRIRSIKGK